MATYGMVTSLSAAKNIHLNLRLIYIKRKKNFSENYFEYFKL